MWITAVDNLPKPVDNGAKMWINWKIFSIFGEKIQ
jgi:hypothetical protein